MSWFGEGLTNLKGQISNFTKEVLAEATAEETDGSISSELELTDQKKVEKLQLLCSSKDHEISRLQQRAQELEARLKLPQAPAASTSAALITASSSQAAPTGPSSAGSAVEEEQDGWSQFSEEDFPCLQEAGDSAAVSAGQQQPNKGLDDEKTILQTKLQDAEVRIQELEQRFREVEESGDGKQQTCNKLVNQIIAMETKGENNSNVFEQLMSLLQPEQSTRTHDLETKCNKLQQNLEKSERISEELKTEVQSFKEENSTLARSLEELDEQNQTAIERVLALKDSLQLERDSLSEQLISLRAQSEREVSNLEEELRAALSQSLPESIAQEVSGSESALLLGRAVARQCADLLWKKEASERKLAEVTREAREIRQELATAKSEVSKLREHSDRLMGQLSVAGPSSSGALESIPEDHEEESELPSDNVTESNSRVISHASQHNNLEAVQREVEALREARENLEAEVGNLRTENQTLVTRIHSLSAERRNQENLQIEATACSEQAVNLKQQLKDAILLRESLENDLESTRTQLNELKEKLKCLHKLEASLQENQSLLAQIQSDKESTENSLNKEIARLKQDLEAEVLQKQNSQQLLADLQQQIDVLRSESSITSSLQHELETVRTSANQTVSENKAIKTECNNLTQQLEKSNDKIQYFEMKLKESETQKELLQVSLEEQKKAQQDTSTYSEIIEKYSQQIICVTEDNKLVESKCKNLTETISSLETKLKEKQHELEKDLEQKLRMAHDVERLKLEVENALAEKLQVEGLIVEKDEVITHLNSKIQSNNQQFEQNIENEIQARKELEDKYDKLEQSYKDVINVAENLESETIKWKNEAELVMSKTDEDDSLIKRLESEISEWRHKAVNIEESYQMTSQGYQEIVKAMESKEKAENQYQIDIEKLKAEVESLTEALNLKCSEYSTLKENASLLKTQQDDLTVINTNQISELELKCKDYEQHIAQLKLSIDEIEKLNQDYMTSCENLNGMLSDEKKRLEQEKHHSNTLSEELKNITIANENISKDNQTLREELSTVIQKLESLESEKSSMQQESAQIAKDSSPLQADFESLKQHKLVLEAEIVSLKQQITEFEDMKYQYSSLQAEKSSILGVMDEKSRENTSLRSDNHRLMALVATEKATSQQLLQEKTELLSRREFQSSEASEMARESVASLAKIIRDKDQELESLKSKNQSLLTLMQDSNPGLAIHQLFTHHPDIELMKNEVVQLQEEKSQLVTSLQQKHHESLQYHAEIQRLSAALSSQPQLNISPSSEIMSKGGADLDQVLHSLSQEQQRNKFLQNEVQELTEKESALQGELSRLRQHLVLVEEEYTEEALRSEQLTQELRAQLATAEERARNTVTSLSSASARAGQQVEHLLAEARTALVQRDDAVRRLAAAEEEVRQHTTALRNLQTVLEQFQQDKNRDIELAGERLCQQLKASEHRSNQLMAEIKGLQAQLQEAKEGLSAAARLGMQMDKKSDQIANLKEEVAKLGEQLQQAQGQINSASQSMEGKVDKYLIKNLIVGYFMTAPNNRLEALRIVATVLDFSREERTRVGLEAAGKSPQTKAAGGQTQSLAEAFIRFLENESRPVPQVRMLEEAVGRQRKASPAPVRSSLLTNEMVLPSFAPVPMMPSPSGSTSSSTLKDVLRDS